MLEIFNPAGHAGSPIPVVIADAGNNIRSDSTIGDCQRRDYRKVSFRDLSGALRNRVHLCSR